MIVRALLLLAIALAAVPARAQEPACGLPVRTEKLGEYRPVFLACVNGVDERRLAIRQMTSGADSLLLLVDAQSLTTTLEPANCWRCAETTDEAEADARFLRALQKPPPGATPKALENAGLVHSPDNMGAFVTGDLCPSRRPLDRGFLERLAREGPGTPIALSVSGAWIKNHAADLDWLKREDQSGALKISWVDHSYSHPYVKGRPDAQTYLLTPGVDMDREIFATEQLMIENGLTPSVFFRFPGLVSDAALMERLRAAHLIALGADAWIALGLRPRPGSIVLVHPNGNEPVGLKMLSRILDQGGAPKPLRPIEDAPAGP
ncbi:MAG TPA: polysaccharide deacetylase [Methylocystis sp.]|nr:polysaccharide deacetylase [Methylocystis sp.]